jgi:hypothetical protein
MSFLFLLKNEPISTGSNRFKSIAGDVGTGKTFCLAKGKVKSKSGNTLSGRKSGENPALTRNCDVHLVMEQARSSPRY